MRNSQDNKSTYNIPLTEKQYSEAGETSQLIRPILLVAHVSDEMTIHCVGSTSGPYKSTNHIPAVYTESPEPLLVYMFPVL